MSRVEGRRLDFEFDIMKLIELIRCLAGSKHPTPSCDVLVPGVAWLDQKGGKLLDRTCSEARYSGVASRTFLHSSVLLTLCRSSPLAAQ